MSLKKYFKLIIVLSTIFSIIGVFFLSILTYKGFIPSLRRLSQKSILSKYEKIIIENHNSIQNFIKFNKAILFKVLKNKLKEEVNLAYQISYGIFKEHLNKFNKEDLQKEIIDVLRNLRFNEGRGYFFIFDVNGKRILYPLSPQKEGENILNLKDATGNYFVKKIIKLILLKRECFYEYICPHPIRKERFYRKFSYMMLFEPYQWIIGAGDYYYDLMQKFRKDVLKKITLFTFPENIGFIIKEDNKIIFKKNILQKFKIPQKRNNKLIDNGDFIFYTTYLPELNWELISVFDKKNAINELNIINGEVSNIIKFIIISISFGCFIFLGILLFNFNRFNKIITIEFEEFKNFIKDIPLHFKKISQEKFKFQEFKSLAKYANNMSQMLQKSFQEIEERKNYLEVITENSGVGIAIINKDGKIEFFNNEFKKILNIESKNIISPYFELFKLKGCIKECDFNSDKCVISNVFRKKQPFISQSDFLVTNDNREIPIFMIANPIIDKDKVEKIVLIIRNITEEKRIKGELLKLKRAIEQAPVSIVITDINGIIEYVNPFFCKITGYSFEEIIGKKPSILKTEYNKKLYDNLWNTIRSGKVWNGEFLNKKKSGKLYWENAIIGPVLDENNRIINYVAVKQDITELKELQSKLLKAKEEAEHAYKVKSDFLASMSHEIRTPMNAILGFIELLYDTELTDKQKEYLKIVRSSSENLMKILNDILYLSKLEVGKMEFEEIEFDLYELLSNCLNIFSKKAGEKGLSLKLNIDKNVPRFFKGDITRITQIFNNLLSNAVKFTEKGEIGIEVKLKTLKSDSAELLFLVYDTGIGISENKLGTIFESFSQADSSITRQYGGTGLGLVIVSRIIEKYNGKIWVESKVGEGSKFYFTLNLKITTASHLKDYKKKIEHKIKFSGIKVLVVEDNIPNQILIKEMLKKFNIEVDLANNGIEALELLGTNNYDLIFIDWHMPVMDGVETVKILRKIEKNESVEKIDKDLVEKLKNKKYIVIALTAAALQEERKILTDAGFDEYLPKPIVMEELLKILEKYLQKDKIKINLEELKKDLNYDEQIINQLMQSFKKTLEDNLKILEKAILTKDKDKIKFSAHSIKGAALNLKLNEIGKIAEKIEENIKDENYENIEKLYEKLKTFQEEF